MSHDASSIEAWNKQIIHFGRLSASSVQARSAELSAGTFASSVNRRRSTNGRLVPQHRPGERTSARLQTEAAATKATADAMTEPGPPRHRGGRYNGDGRCDDRPGFARMSEGVNKTAEPDSKAKAPA